MDFRKKYINATEKELIYVIENPEIFRPDVIDIAKDIFSMRLISDEAIQHIAVEVNAERIKTKMAKLNPAMDDISIHTSYFLEKSTIKQLYIEALELLIQEKDAFRFDVWKYAIGGF